ncbi:MAG: HU family DNA-binding protein [Synergistaceae bacterium]|nr:HU family DNA-binding protein [Synergistaceae bacterium]
MTKVDLVNAVAKGVEGLTKKKLAAVIDTVFADIFDSLKKGEKVQLVGFGTFDVQTRAARKGRNPQRPNEVIDIPAKKVPVFRAGKHLKDAVNH